MSDLLHQLQIGPCRIGGRVRLTTSGYLLENAYASIPIFGVNAVDGAMVRVDGSFNGAEIIAHDFEVMHVPVLKGDARPLQSQGANVSSRDLMYRAVRSRMQQMSFVEVETPIRVTAAGTDPYLVRRGHLAADVARIRHEIPPGSRARANLSDMQSVSRQRDHRLP
jgi:hypothetical protein